MKRLAILFDMFGPYHLARLRALGGMCELLALEKRERSLTYAWNPIVSAVNFQRVTLSSKGGSQAAQHGQLRNALADFKPDALLLPGWASVEAIVALEWALRACVPVVLMSESNDRDKGRGLLARLLKRQLCGLYDGALVGGPDHADYLNKLGIDRAAIRFGYDVVDSAFFDIETKKVRKSAESGAAERHTPYFLASARFIPEKNLPLLLEAYATYRRCVSQPWDLVLLGDGPERSALEAAINGQGLGGCVRLPGFVQYPDLPVFYGRASAFVHVSRVEPWGLVVNEALASGLPVIVSEQCGCSTSLVVDGRNGRVVDANDMLSIADAMAWVADDLDRLTRLSDASYQIIADFTPDRFGTGAIEAADYAITNYRPKSRVGLAVTKMVRAVI